MSDATRPVDRRELLLLAAILLLATVLRVAWPTLTEFKFSEARLEALALELTREGRLPLVGVPSSAGFDHSPLSVYLYVPAFILTTDPIPATIYGGLMGVAAVALCWWLARRWSGGGCYAALVAALLFAVSPWAVAFSRKIWQVTFVPVLALAFVGLMVSALVRGRRWSLGWALVVYAVLVQVHPSAVSLGLALLLWLIVFWREVRLLPLLVGAGLALLTAVPFLVHQVQSDWPVLSALGALPESIYDFTAARLAWEAITGRGIHALAGEAYPLLEIVPQLGWFFNVVGWLTIGAGLWLAWRSVTGWRSEDVNRRQAARVDLILLSWLVVPIVFNLRYSLDLHLHFFALVLPAAYLIVGRAVESLGHQLRIRWLPIAGAIGLGLLAIAQVVALVLMARFVSTHDTPGGFGIPLGRYLGIADEAVALAAEEQAAEVLAVARGASVVVDELPAIFDVLLRGRVGYRFVDGESTALFPAHRAVVLLAPDAGDAAAWYQSWPAQPLPDGYQLVDLDGSWPQNDFASISGPRLFENGVEAQGYHWAEDAPSSGVVRFWFLWQVLWQHPDDTHFFVTLLDAEEQVKGQADVAGYPVLYRRKGDRIVNLFDIISAGEDSPRSHSARLGQYYYPQVVNVPVVDEAGNPFADSILIPLGVDAP
jgi:hypothetical protein